MDKELKEIYHQKHRWESSPHGYAYRMYDRMLKRVKTGRPKYRSFTVDFTLDEFKDFLKTTNYLELLDAYRESGRDIRLAPSVDRIDNDRGYSLDNIQIITQSENSRKGNLGKKIYPTEEQRKRMSGAALEKFRSGRFSFTEEIRKKISVANTGKKRTAEGCRNISEGKKRASARKREKAVAEVSTSN